MRHQVLMWITVTENVKIPISQCILFVLSFNQAQNMAKSIHINYSFKNVNLCKEE